MEESKDTGDWKGSKSKGQGQGQAQGTGMPELDTVYEDA